MEIKKFKIEGPLFFGMSLNGDARGFFCERFRLDLFSEALPGVFFCQENYSRSAPGTLRGLHFQNSPSQGKLVTVTNGSIADVIVDLRSDSVTFKQHMIVELSGRKPSWLWVPPGFAHGFCVLGEEPADLLYKTTSYYNSAGEGGVRWNDPELNIQWPIDPNTISARDQNLPLVRNLANSNWSV